MKINHAAFAASAFTLEQLPVDKLPQIALVGGSNVGKSSLINQLGRAPKLALISSTPGKTASINYYKFNNAFYLVDLPGYGYAKVSNETKKSWVELIEGYLDFNERLMGVVLVVDIRHSPKPDDLGFIAWAKKTGMPVIIVANKADKFGRSQQVVNTKRLVAELGVDAADVILFSAADGMGKETLLRFMSDRLLALDKKPAKAKPKPTEVPADTAYEAAPEPVADPST
ncbi:MAG: YihA family ribosome biogenesis GTP-binding protein [Candidatus Sericytochromatia bacterium]|nr:YihA family ribosome biogenesis GTP-binding protein [Candidatus Sericytochromatia bacterium]